MYDDLSICISCGAYKDHPARKCEACGYDPVTDMDVAKSIYLSVLRFEDEAAQVGYRRTLAEMQSVIESGGSIEYASGEIERIFSQKQYIESVGLTQALLFLLRVFWPALLVVAAIIVALWLL